MSEVIDNGFKSALQKVVDMYGSGAALARELGLHGQAITDWKKRGKVPKLRAMQIEKVTGGAIKAESLSQSEK